jgi:hypothetical protein
MTAKYFLDTNIAFDNQDIREPFDYTEWRKDLWEDLSVREITQSAMNFARQKRKERFEHD